MSTWSFDHATINRVIDGDTVSVIVDIGFGVTYTSNFRLLGCNARELSMPGGKEARANLTALLPAGTQVKLQSVKNDKYGGRYLAVIYLGDVNITTTLINTGWAAAWDGVGTAPAPAWPRP